MPNQILKRLFFENFDFHKKITKIEDFKVDHSKKTTKFIDNPQNASNLLQDFLYKNSRFGKFSSFFESSTLKSSIFSIFKSISKNPEDSRSYVQRADNSFTVHRLKMKAIGWQPPVNYCQLYFPNIHISGHQIQNLAQVPIRVGTDLKCLLTP